MVEKEDTHFDAAKSRCRECEHGVFGLKDTISWELVLGTFVHTLAVVTIAGLMVERSVLGAIIPSCGVGYPSPCRAMPLRKVSLV